MQTILTITPASPPPISFGACMSGSRERRWGLSLAPVEKLQASHLDSGSVLLNSPVGKRGSFEPFVLAFLCFSILVDLTLLLLLVEEERGALPPTSSFISWAHRGVVVFGFASVCRAHSRLRLSSSACDFLLLLEINRYSNQSYRRR